MDIAQPEKKAQLKREKSKEAIALALEGKWERAIEINQGMLRLFPEDVEAMNRLGKACLELGRYYEAREAFESATKIAPHNTISKRNLERLTHLQESTMPLKQGKVVTPHLFIEESGKSGITALQKPATRQMLAKVAAGDVVNLQCRDHTLVVENSQGECLGQVESKLGIRLMRLIKGGNRYDAAVTSVNRQEISVIIWESFRHPDLSNARPFPSKTKEQHRFYLRDSTPNHGIGIEPEEDDAYASDRKAGYSGGMELSEDDEPSDSRYPGQAQQEDSDGDDE